MFDPQRHYLILCKQFTEDYSGIVGRRCRHTALLSLIVAVLRDAVTWRPTPDSRGEAYMVHVSVDGVEMDFRVHFPTDKFGDPLTAPGGNMTVVFAHRAYRPRVTPTAVPGVPSAHRVEPVPRR